LGANALPRQSVVAGPGVVLAIEGWLTEAEGEQATWPPWMKIAPVPGVEPTRKLPAA